MSFPYTGFDGQTYQYTPFEHIATGAYGRVFAAEGWIPGSDKSRLLAAKRLVKDVGSEETVERIHSELGQLAHPNLIKYYGTSMAENDQYVATIISEYCSGKNQSS